MSPARTRDMFDHIVSQLDDPELRRIRRRIEVLSATFLALAVVVTIVGGLGWQTLVAFCATFLPSMIVVRRISSRPLG